MSNPSSNGTATASYANTIQESDRKIAASNSQPSAKQAAEAHFAEQAYHQAAANPVIDSLYIGHDSNRARNYAMSKKLISVYMERFNMNGRQAKAAVERDMGDKYASNPWDTQPRVVSHSEARSTSGGTGKKKEEKGEKSCPLQEEATQYSEEQWNLYETTFA